MTPMSAKIASRNGVIPIKGHQIATFQGYEHCPSNLRLSIPLDFEKKKRPVVIEFD